MPDESNTVRLHRVLRAAPERVYRAFLEPDAMARWLPPHGFTGKVHHMDARVGGGYRMSFTNFGTGKSHAFGGEYVVQGGGSPEGAGAAPARRGSRRSRESGAEPPEASNLCRPVEGR